MSSAPPDVRAVMRHLLRGYGVEPSTEPLRIKGMGASKGIARGRARIIFGLVESQRRCL